MPCARTQATRQPKIPMAKVRTYSELRRIHTFEERFDYLILHGLVGHTTFGFDRWVNQQFYRSRSWRLVRGMVLVRDFGCDLGIVGYDIHVNPIVHHMNPMMPEDIEHGEEWILDPEFLITTSQCTHNAIHYGDSSLLPSLPAERQPGDTKLW
jgi:hypothetical protein